MRLIALGATALLLACGADGRLGAPTRSQFLDLPVTSWIGQEPVTVDTVDRPEVRLELSAVAFRVGENPRSDAEEFGVIRHGLFLGDGALVVSDFAKDRLTYIPAGGEGARTFGRNGQGPGEFHEPSHLLSLDGAEVLAIDNGNQRLSRLRVAGGVLELVDDHGFLPKLSGLADVPMSMCPGGGGLVAITYDLISQRPFHVLGEDGDLVSSFGSPFLEGSNRLNAAITDGRLLCLPDQSAVVVALHRGELLAYGLNGALLWRRILPDFMPVLVELKGGGVLFKYLPEPHGYSQYITGLARLNDTLGVVQVATQRLVDGGIAVTELESRFFDLRDGQEIGRQHDLARVLAVRGDRLLLTADDPEPWVEVRRFRVVPRDR